MAPTFANTARTLEGRKPSASVFENNNGGQDRFKPKLVVDNTKKEQCASERQLARVLENRENGVFTPW